MIELKELTLGYGQRTLLKTVNARITGGQLVALLGLSLIHISEPTRH